MPNGGTPLAPAMKCSFSNFLLSDKTRKILIIITDDEPDNKFEALEARGLLNRFGIEVLGLVVTARAYPLDLFDDSEVITLAKDLPAALSKLVRRNL